MKVIFHMDGCSPGRELTLDGLWTDRTSAVQELAQKAILEDDLIKPRRWSVYQDIQQRLAYPMAWPSTQRHFLAARAVRLERALGKPRVTGAQPGRA